MMTGVSCEVVPDDERDGLATGGTVADLVAEVAGIDRGANGSWCR